MSCVILCSTCYVFFFFNDTATTEIYTLSLHDALPIWFVGENFVSPNFQVRKPVIATKQNRRDLKRRSTARSGVEDQTRSEEHTSELQSRQYLVCRLLLEKKKNVSPTKRQDRTNRYRAI